MLSNTVIKLILFLEILQFGLFGWGNFCFGMAISQPQFLQLIQFKDGSPERLLIDKLSDGYALKIKLTERNPKEEESYFEIGESIPVEMKIIRKNNNKYQFNNFKIINYNIHINDSSQNPVDPVFDIAGNRVQFNKMLKPDGQLTAPVLLNYLFNLINPGKYSVKIDLDIQNKDGFLFNLTSNKIDFFLVNKKHQRIFGKESEGFKLSLTSQQKSYKKNEDIELIIVLLNNSSRIRDLVMNSSQYRFRIEKVGTGRIVEIALPSVGATIGQTLSPQSEIGASFLLNKFYDFSEKGEYIIWGVRSIPTLDNSSINTLFSNPILIIIRE